MIKHFLSFGLTITIAILTPIALAHADSSARGQIITAEPMAIDDTLAAVTAKATRITYGSTDPAGNPITVSGAVLEPKNQPASDGKIVAWGHGTEGPGDSCAPSVNPNLDTFPGNLYSAEVAAFLAQGWTVTASDYPGLGTPGEPPFIVGANEGRAVIDSVRAARKLNPTLSNRFSLVGHSQGGQAVLWASQMMPEYGHGLKLKGVVGLAAPTDLADLAQRLLGLSPYESYRDLYYQGYTPMAVMGLSQQYAQLDPQQILQPAVYDNEVLRNGCVLDVLNAFAFMPPEEVVDTSSQQWPLFLDLLDTQNPGQQPSSAPVLLVQGEADNIVLPEAATKLATAYCSYGNTVATNLYPGEGHDTIIAASANDVVDWLDDRFAGAAAPSDCNDN